MLGQNLRAIREQRGFTQYALAKASGLAASYIYRIEEGRAKRPSHETLQKLAAALEVAVEDLVDPREWSTSPLADEAEMGYLRRLFPEVKRLAVKDPIALIHDLGSLSAENQAFIADMISSLGRRESTIVSTEVESEPGADAKRKRSGTPS